MARLFEHQGKTILKNSGIPVPAGEVADTPAKAKDIAAKMGRPVVIKGQVWVAGLGKIYKMTGIGFKFYSACRGICGTLDTVAAIASANNINIEDVDQVIIKVSDINSIANYPYYEPAYKIQAEFSIPYTATMILMHEPTGPNWYTEDKLNNPKIRQYQHRVKYREARATTLTEEEMKASGGILAVEIVMQDGRRFSEPVGIPKGEPERTPFTRQEHVDKLFNMGAWLGMKQPQLDELLNTFDNLEKLESISQLTGLLSVK